MSTKLEKARIIFSKKPIAFRNLPVKERGVINRLIMEVRGREYSGIDLFSIRLGWNVRMNFRLVNSNVLVIDYWVEGLLGSIAHGICYGVIHGDKIVMKGDKGVEKLLLRNSTIFMTGFTDDDLVYIMKNLSVKKDEILKLVKNNG